ncbi:MAG: CooT family nickel-binding protein [Anaerolineales bacterium]|jgi:predicted RNA-binding protein
MMCQATVYLDGEVIMEDVWMVEPVPEGVRLIALFEPVQVVPAAIRQIDLIKHKVILESHQEIQSSHQHHGEATHSDSELSISKSQATSSAAK